jgi:hypothetical protein
MGQRETRPGKRGLRRYARSLMTKSRLLHAYDENVRHGNRPTIECAPR